MYWLTVGFLFSHTVSIMLRYPTQALRSSKRQKVAGQPNRIAVRLASAAARHEAELWPQTLGLHAIAAPAMAMRSDSGGGSYSSSSSSSYSSS